MKKLKEIKAILMAQKAFAVFIEIDKDDPMQGKDVAYVNSFEEMLKWCENFDKTIAAEKQPTLTIFNEQGMMGILCHKDTVNPELGILSDKGRSKAKEKLVDRMLSNFLDDALEDMGIKKEVKPEEKFDINYN